MSRDCYNSYFFRVEDPAVNVLDKLKLHGRAFTRYLDGGSACHINLDEHLNKAQYLQLLDAAIRTGCSYFTFNIPNTLCRSCGYISKHRMDACPSCGGKDLDYATRIIGYLKLVSRLPTTGSSKKENVTMRKECLYEKENPSDACEPPRVEKEEIQYLDPDQITALLQAVCGHRFEGLYTVCLFTGMRQAEAIGLAWGGIDFEKGTIHLYQQLQLIEGEYQFGPLKNDKPRTITAAASVMGVLREQKRIQAEWKLQAGQAWENSGLVFTDELDHHLARQTVYQQFQKIVTSIGLPATRFHGMRHSYAVSSIQAGDDIKTLQENLGHHTAAFTLDQYGHVTEQMKQASAARMEAFIQGVKRP